MASEGTLVLSASRACTCTTTCCRWSILHHQSLPWDLKAVCVSQKWSATILFLPLAWVASHISVPSQPLFPLFQLRSSPLLSAHTTSDARTRPHRHANLCTCHPCPHADSLPSSLSRVFPLALGNASSQGGQDFLQSLELINSKVAANSKLWEKDNKLEMHQCLSWPGMGANENTPPPPLSPCPAAFRSYMCSHVSSDLYSLKRAFKAVLLTKVPGDIFKFSLVA